MDNPYQFFDRCLMPWDRQPRGCCEELSYSARCLYTGGYDTSGAPNEQGCQRNRIPIRKVSADKSSRYGAPMDWLSRICRFTDILAIHYLRLLLSKLLSSVKSMSYGQLYVLIMPQFSVVFVLNKSA